MKIAGEDSTEAGEVRGVDDGGAGVLNLDETITRE